MSTADRLAYNTFVSSVSLVAINTVAIAGERRAAGEASQTRFDLAASFQVENNAVHYRFDVIGQLTDPAGADYGHVSASVIVTVSTAAIPDSSCIERFGNVSAMMMAHPYLREALASTAQRLGFPGVLLPILTRESVSAPWLDAGDGVGKEDATSGRPAG